VPWTQLLGATTALAATAGWPGTPLASLTQRTSLDNLYVPPSATGAGRIALLVVAVDEDGAVGLALGDVTVAAPLTAAQARDATAVATFASAVVDSVRTASLSNGADSISVLNRAATAGA
jgi:hypothetical protein